MSKNNNIVNLKKVKRLRKERHLGRDEIATLLGLNSPYTYRNRELGYIDFSIKDLYTLAKFYGLTIEDLLLIEEDDKEAK